MLRINFYEKVVGFDIDVHFQMSSSIILWDMERDESFCLMEAA